MGLEFEIRNIRKFDDDLKRICACYAARVESMEISRSGTTTLFAIARELRHAYQCARHRKKYFADYRGVSAWSGAEQGDLQPPEADVNALAAVLMPAMLGAPPLLIGVPCTVKAAINARQNGIIRHLFNI